MSIEEINESTAEVVETPEVTDVPEVNETSEATASEVSLESIYEMSDEELQTAIANEFTSSPKESEQLEAVKEIEEVEEVEDTTSSLDLDYEAIYKEIFSPFKANGRDIQVDSVDEVKRLMQQGLGYHKKMEELKPFNKALNLLKKRQALDPEKLNFLLDIADGKPEALAKLLQDQKIDPYDIDLQAEYVSDYEDTEELDKIYNVIDQLDGKDKIKTLQVLSGDTAWDQESTTRLYKNPQAIVHLNQQVHEGIFDKIMAVVDKERALGNLIGISDLDAYNKIGQELQNQGKLGVPNTPNESTSNSRTAKQIKNQNEQRKKAASAPRKVTSTAPNSEQFIPAIADDAEIERFIQDHLRNSR